MTSFPFESNKQQSTPNTQNWTQKNAGTVRHGDLLEIGERYLTVPALLLLSRSRTLGAYEEPPGFLRSVVGRLFLRFETVAPAIPAAQPTDFPPEPRRETCHLPRVTQLPPSRGRTTRSPLHHHPARSSCWVMATATHGARTGRAHVHALGRYY